MKNRSVKKEMKLELKSQIKRMIRLMLKRNNSIKIFRKNIVILRVRKDQVRERKRYR